MILEKQVCSLELAKRLKKLGVKQESQFYWKNYCLTAYNYQKEDFFISDTTYDQDDNYSNNYLRKRHSDQEIYSAFTVAELGEIFAQHTFKNKTLRCMFVPDSHDRNAIYRTYLESDKDSDNYVIEWAHTEADSRAQMLIYLLENKLLTL